jgi:hypothetical protein
MYTNQMQMDLLKILNEPNSIEFLNLFFQCDQGKVQLFCEKILNNQRKIIQYLHRSSARQQARSGQVRCLLPRYAARLVAAAMEAPHFPEFSILPFKPLRFGCPAGQGGRGGRLAESSPSHLVGMAQRLNPVFLALAPIC